MEKNELILLPAKTMGQLYSPNFCAAIKNTEN
jgi:hypothetical protein